MSRRSLRHVGRQGAGLVSAFVLLGFSLPASADLDVVAVVNEENPASTVTMHDLRLLYSLYRRSWDRGVRVLLVLPEP